MDSIIIITRYFSLFRKNEPAVDDNNDLKTNANKLSPSNISQSNTDDPIDASKKPDELEIDADNENFCRFNVDGKDKMSPNHNEPYRNKNDERKQKTMPPYVEASGMKHLGRLGTQPNLKECKASSGSRPSSPITGSIPKDLSIVKQMPDAASSVEASQSNPMDMSILTNKISSIKSIDSFDKCKYIYTYIHIYIYIYNYSEKF